MKNRELIQYLQGLDPEAIPELDIDVYSLISVKPGARQTRRIVEVLPSKDGRRITIVGDGNLRPHEEELLENGHYNRFYGEYEAMWNGCDRSTREVILLKADIASAGYRIGLYVEDSWDELKLVIQQCIMVRHELPQPAEVVA